MPTVTDICNQALSRLGEPAISGFSANEPNAIVCRAHYDTVRDSLLRSHPWNFATGRVQLSQLATAPDFGWSYAYQLPADWLRVVTLNGREAKLCSATYVIEGTTLLTDSSEAKITYVRKVADPGVFDSLFLDVLIFRLASAIAMDVKGSSQFRDEMEQLAALRLGDANFVDANETRIEVLSPLSGSRGAAARGAYKLIGSGLAPYGPTLEQIELENGDDGAPGWTPSFAIASDGARRVVQITGWSGGEGTAPETGYLGVSGIVGSAASAVDIRGAAGDGGGTLGPGSSVDNAIALFDGVTGELLKDSGILIGTAANNVIQLNGSGELPVVSGANLTGLPIPAVDNASVNTAIEEDAAASRTSLGLGSAALAATGDFATAAQGALADSATQPGDLGNSAGLDVGTTAGTVAAGDDSRLSDARTPTSHTHGNITNAGAIGSTSGLPVKTGASGVLEASAFGTGSGQFAEGNDSRLTDERVPTAAGLTTKFGTNKATIVDGDKIGGLDSAAADTPKHWLFSLIKSTLKTYFDTLYAAVLGVDDNYVTDAEKVVIGNTSGTNTGDQTNISGNAATVTTNANLTGPVTSTGNATAIANGAISNAMLANMAEATIKGRAAAAGTGVPVDLTASQARTALGLATTDDVDFGGAAIGTTGICDISPGGIITFSGGGLYDQVLAAGGAYIRRDGAIGAGALGFFIEAGAVQPHLTLTELKMGAAGGIGFTATTGLSSPLDAYFSRHAAGVVNVHSFLRLVPTTFASLPTPGTAGNGTEAKITDGATTTLGAVATGGGSEKQCLECDGTDWRVKHRPT